MAFPNFEGKHAHDPLMTPEAMLRYRLERGMLPADATVPTGVVLTYQKELWSAAQKYEDTTAFGGSHPYDCLHLLDRTDHRVGVIGNFGIGAPIAAIVLEDLIALGVRRFVSIGTAGALQRTSSIGDIIVCEEAVRDEGVSHHYVSASRMASGSPRLTGELAAHLEKAGIDFERGAGWTVDSPYRETVEEARHYQSEGVWCVEMEAAALFAVAEYRDVDLACALCISDSLADLEWDPQFHSPALRSQMWRVFQAAVDTLAG